MAEQLANIPANDLPALEELDGYRGRTAFKPSLAWSNRFNELCAWVSDYEESKKRAAEERERDSQSPFDYRT